MIKKKQNLCKNTQKKSLNTEFQGNVSLRSSVALLKYDFIGDFFVFSTASKNKISLYRISLIVVTDL